MCLLYVPVSYCLPDIYISQLQAQHFPDITSDDVMNHIKAFQHLYSSLRMLIFVLVLMSVNMQISLAACLCFKFTQMMDQMHNFTLMKCCVLTLKPHKC